MKLNDTIAAIATPRGAGGIAIIRISGTHAIEIASKIVFPLGKIPLEKCEDRKLTLCRIQEPSDGGYVIDRTLAVVMRAPKTYTGEDVVEINCHGGYLAADKTLDALFKCGARLAEPGEFTRRAFINGKTDLCGAEAVMDLMDSTSEAGLHNAAMSLCGGIAEKINGIRERVLALASHISAAADYPEEVDAPEPDEALSGLSDIHTELKALADGFDTGRVMRDGVRTAIVGKPNVGKSSILNALLKFERAIVTDIPGTTRDTIEELISVGGIALRLIDTAGIRKKAKVDYGVEKFAVDRAIRSIRECDVALMVIDATEATNGISDQDKKIASIITEAGKGMVIAINKWDLIEDKKSNTINKFEEKIAREIPFLDYVPKIYISAVTHQRLNQIFTRVVEAQKERSKRVSTGLLNKVINEAYALNPPQTIRNKRLKIMYSTQAAIEPPTFILFANSEDLMKDHYKRYMENKLREAFGFMGTPIRLSIRTRSEKKK